MNAQFGAVCFVYNKYLAIMKYQYKVHGKLLKDSKDIKPLLSATEKSRKYSWLNNYDSISLQEACRNLNKAFSKSRKAKCHGKTANARNDFQHKVTRKIIDANQAIVVETLKVKNMLKNHKLARSISDCAFGMLLDKL